MVSKPLKSASLLAAVNAISAFPASADAGKIFDFNLTLPVMVTEFLLLMVFLDKAWFGPVGKILDERDAFLREKLGSVKDNSGELKSLQQQAEKVLAEARAEAQRVIQAAKSEVQGEQNKKLSDTKEVRCQYFVNGCRSARRYSHNGSRDDQHACDVAEDRQGACICHLAAGV